ncbi:hypothetical protein [Methylobacterium radiodurans]|uniref:Uncharacterized protein n=1 Tax=Methylobacterium radiodurans TaxID=2202828 RepID=A0A2U8VYC9_9HYPH|nr:hypothetical protein [Methylobacterium radiodurans]AWN38262.1 hypothetical protein DK427_23050 [Methylobacterium radiodurans]
MGTGTRRRPDVTAQASAIDLDSTPIERIAVALGYPPTIFTDGTPVEARLAETAELLRLWSRVREPEAAERILAFLAAIVAEQS